MDRRRTGAMWADIRARRSRLLLLSVHFVLARDDCAGGRRAVTANDRFHDPAGAGPSTFGCGSRHARKEFSIHWALLPRARRFVPSW